MNSYEIWVNLRPNVSDLEFVSAVQDYTAWFIKRNLLSNFRLKRRKFGFGPEGLGEFHLTLDFETLAQMDAAFDEAARREGEIDHLHARVYALVKDFKSGLYRDFPDPVRRLN